MNNLFDGTLVEVGIAGFVLPGQQESGDLEIVLGASHGALLGVVDGLGHGMEAALAAKEAIRILRSSPGMPITSLLKSCHEALRTTRGVTMSLAELNGDENTMSWLGIGNVEGILIRRDPSLAPSETLLLRPGVLGYILPPLQETSVPLFKGDLLIFASDGIRNTFPESIPAGSELPAQGIAERLCAQHTKGSDDALVLVGRYIGQRP